MQSGDVIVWEGRKHDMKKNTLCELMWKIEICFFFLNEIEIVCFSARMHMQLTHELIK